MNGSLKTVTADFTHGVIDGFRGRVTHETSVQDVPDDYDSDNTSEDEDNKETAGLDLAQKKVRFQNS